MSEDINFHVQPTPNPNAIKLILDRAVKKEGNSTYRTPMECGENKLALELFTIRGVDQLHFFENTITLSKFGYEVWDEMMPKIEGALNEALPAHNPEYFDPDPEAERRRSLSPELLKIEEILDKTIRPGLQADGGDIMALSLEDNILLVKYQGACGTCPSSTTGTLEAIKGILRDEYDPGIDVYIAPDF
ncbi:NifU family protein [Halobacteriovorax sp. GB3]|uniref:NifU family protein n=1 Tax=Halobacteriovorax sp. GB3 TaxID=2719615 RepID=UPI002360CF78|nr:NifU family protein [Halobacteriovorax sp. GB3]MDD0852269.1 NifU family protein [Halobacteriovorax sp. GB3]